MRRLILTLRPYRDKYLAFNLARAWRTAGRLLA